MTQDVLPNPAAPEYHLYSLQKIKYKSNYICPKLLLMFMTTLGWKIVYLSAQRLSFCPYALYNSHRSRFLFPFALFCQTKNTSNSSMQLCSFLKWACIWTVLDCCLELCVIPVSCSKCGCVSRPVHMRLHYAHILNARPWERTVV